MEIIKAEFSKELYESLPQLLRDEIDIKNVDEVDFDYSEDEIWQELKKESTKAYKKLKEREFILRHNIKK